MKNTERKREREREGGRRVRREEKLENQKSVGPRERGRCARDRDAHLVTLLRPKARVSKISRHRRLFVCWGFRSPQVRRPGVACVDREGSGAERTRLSIPLPPVQPPRVRASARRRTTLRAATFTTVFSQHPSKKKQVTSVTWTHQFVGCPTARREIYTERSSYSRGFVGHMIPWPFLEIFGNFWKFCPFSAREVSRKKCAIKLGLGRGEQRQTRWRGGGARG